MILDGIIDLIAVYSNSNASEFIKDYSKNSRSSKSGLRFCYS